MGVEGGRCTAQMGIDLQTPAWLHLFSLLIARHAHDGLEGLERTPGMLAETRGDRSRPDKGAQRRLCFRRVR